MYPEVREIMKKLDLICGLDLRSYTEVGHLMFEFWSTAYNQGVEDTLPETKE